MLAVACSEEHLAEAVVNWRVGSISRTRIFRNSRSLTRIRVCRWGFSDDTLPDCSTLSLLDLIVEDDAAAEDGRLEGIQRLDVSLALCIIWSHRFSLLAAAVTGALATWRWPGLVRAVNLLDEGSGTVLYTVFQETFIGTEGIGD